MKSNKLVVHCKTEYKTSRPSMWSLKHFKVPLCTDGPHDIDGHQEMIIIYDQVMLDIFHVYTYTSLTTNLTYDSFLVQYVKLSMRLHTKQHLLCKYNEILIPHLKLLHVTFFVREHFDQSGF